MASSLCQVAGAALLLGAASSAAGQYRKEMFQQVSPEVRTARMFFAALDDGNIAQASANVGPDISQTLPAAIRARRVQFGARWSGDTGPREVVRVDDGGGGGKIVTFRARYERATLEQVAFVSCMKMCQVTAFKEGPVYAKAY